MDNYFSGQDMPPAEKPTSLGEIIFACRYLDAQIDAEEAKGDVHNWLFNLRQERAEWYKILDHTRRELLPEAEPLHTLVQPAQTFAVARRVRTTPKSANRYAVGTNREAKR